MTKNEYLQRLEKSLKVNQVSDFDDILAEYDQHFSFKSSDGYSEEEIAANLENPELLAKQFALAGGIHKNTPGNIALSFGVFVASLFSGMFFIILFAWVLVMGALAVSSLTASICLIGSLNISNLLPHIPFIGGLIFGISLFAFALLISMFTAYCSMYVVQLMKAYFRWCRNTLASGRGLPVYPSLQKFPQLRIVTRRRMRSIALFCVTLFGVSFIIGYLVMALRAGSLEFWHIWHWFE